MASGLPKLPPPSGIAKCHLKFCSCQLRDLEASAAISSFMLLERRASPRLPEFNRAEIVFNDNLSRMVCIVVNASEQGAMLRVRDGADVPDTFNLLWTIKFTLRGLFGRTTVRLVSTG